MVDFKIDQLQLVGLGAFMGGDLDTFVGTDPLALPAGDAEVIAGIRVDRQSQSAAKMSSQILNLVRVFLGRRLPERMNEYGLETFTNSLETFYSSI